MTMPVSADSVAQPLPAQERRTEALVCAAGVGQPLPAQERRTRVCLSAAEQAAAAEFELLCRAAAEIISELRLAQEHG